MDGVAREAVRGADPPDRCSGFDAAIALLDAGVLPVEEEARVRVHLGACARCRELGRLFESSTSLGEDRPAGDVEPGRGRVLQGRYRLDRVLGCGGMGVVWSATQLSTGQSVAIKLLAAEADGDRGRRRLLREARATCAVAHPGIVRVLDVVETDEGSPALVMERLAGHSLRRRFDEGPMSVAELCHVLARVAEAMEAAHAAGIVHRDLKPDNVFLARTIGGSIAVRVLDFGLAKPTLASRGRRWGTLTETGALLGTPFYMSPEQALGDADVDLRADVWALGMMLYQGLSGVLPTRADHLGRVIKAIAMAPIAPIEQLVPDLPGDLAELVGRALARPRAERVGSMAEARAILERHAAPHIADRPELDEHGGRPTEAPSVLATPVAPERSRAAPTRLRAALAGAALISLTSLAIAVRVRPSPLRSSSLPIVQASPVSVARSLALLPATALPPSDEPISGAASATAKVEPSKGPKGLSPARPHPPAEKAPAPAPKAAADIGVVREF